ncbi:EboA domain-containing protein [Tellurirhabdus rosea]|uniref:EboA domain-containing protein n=1 Tax=Tellurirhabdus rosea TaxID=2674997 RepID=UPI002259A38F|nr:EboA domain-containing protein [Tellurirhabdus rosea]
MNPSAIREALLDIIRQQPDSDKAIPYLTQQASIYANQPGKAIFFRVFAALPRFTGKRVIETSPQSRHFLHGLRPGFSVEGWTLDRLARVWWLLHLSAEDRDEVVSTVETLIKSAEMNELVAIYSALPVLPFPDAWRFQATEAVRSNIGPVQDAIMLRNPYASEQLDQNAWNQLIMKAFFNDKDISQIIGHRERRNADLAAIATDFARERRAAGRPVPPKLWEQAEPFVSPELRELF